MSESETFEEKGSFEWGRDGQEFDLLKTIVAFANGEGGEILLKKVRGNRQRLDSARLDDFANKYVSPRLGGIVSRFTGKERCRVTIAKSAFAPHVISQEASFTKANGQLRSAFYPGQVYVRHSSKSEPARGEDLQRIIRDGVSSWLQNLGDAVARLAVGEEADGGMPIRLSPDGPGVSISIGNTHPYTAGEIGQPHGKTGAWIGKLVNVLGLRDDVAYCATILGNKNPIFRFSEAAKARVDQHMQEFPDFNPYLKAG